jgi:hypothetical protein
MGASMTRQTGMTMLGFLLMFMLIGFFTLLVLKIGPIYLEHFKVVNALEALKKEPDLASKSKEDILKILEKRWDINMVNRVTAKDVTITRQSGEVKVQVAYEVVEPIMGNIDVLVYFDDVIASGQN